MTFMVLQFIVSYCCDFEMTKWQIIFSRGRFGSFIKHENMFCELKVSHKREAFGKPSKRLSISWPNYRTQPILCTIETSRAKSSSEQELFISTNDFAILHCYPRWLSSYLAKLFSFPPHSFITSILFLFHNKTNRKKLLALLFFNRSPARIIT